jgi:hypothetical protein
MLGINLKAHLPQSLLGISLSLSLYIYIYIYIYLYNILGWSSFPSICPVIHHHPSLHPSKAKRGRAWWALLKLQNFTVSGNCPFCPIYSTIGIHPVMKGYWSIIKISGRH